MVYEACCAHEVNSTRSRSDSPSPLRTCAWFREREPLTRQLPTSGHLLSRPAEPNLDSFKNGQYDNTVRVVVRYS